MSFNSLERSIAAGTPVRLYEFSRGVMRWLYNSSDRDITVGSQIFRTLRGGITDNGIRQTGESGQDTFLITAPADIEVAQPWRTMRPSAEIGVRVLDMHYGDGDTVCRFVGTIGSVKWPSLDICAIACEDLDSSMQRPGLVDAYSRTCTTTLYSTKCKVDRNTHRIETAIQSISGRTISSGALASYPAGWFSGGYIEWSIGSGEYERRHIETHSGSSLTLLGGVVGLQAGQAIRVYPGCDFTAGTCASKFGNIINFRGFPHMDGKSPFDGDQVF